MLVISPSQVGRLWPGLESTLLLSDASARLGPSATVTSAVGARGLTGAVTANGWAGQAAVFPAPAAGPDDDFAVEIVGVGPLPDRAAAQAATALVARSVRFPAAAQ